MFEDGGLGCRECSDAAGVELEYHSSCRVDPCAVAGESPAVVFQHNVMAEQAGGGLPSGDNAVGVGPHHIEPPVECVEQIAGETVPVGGQAGLDVEAGGRIV